MIDAKKPGSYYLNSICIRPNAKFDVQGEQEIIILVLRAHPATQIGWILLSLLFLIILITLNFFLPSFFTIAHRVLINISGVIYILSYVWLKFILYYYNVGIITNTRVIDIDQISILYRETTEARNEKIEDVTSKSAGYWGAIFNYGNIFVQTAGTEANIEFINIAVPTLVAKIINDVSGRK